MSKFYSRFCVLLLLFASFQASAQLPQLSFTAFATGINRPICIASAGDSRLFIIEQGGTIIILDSTGTKKAIPFLDITSIVNSAGTERGLLGLAFHPDYAQNGYFYVNYTSQPDGDTRIARYTRSAANPDLADPASAVVLLNIVQPYSNHNGGNMLFGKDGYLYIGMGDGGAGGDPQNNAQNGQQLLGKMLRIDVDSGSPYGIPADNPFVADPAVQDEIWAIGLRNPWRWSFDRVTGDMWIADVGQNTWEEINFEPAGSGAHNYGWRCYEALVPFNTAGCAPQSSYTDPVYEYDHSGANGCSVTGGFVYRGARYGRLYGHYLHTDYCSGQFWSTVQTSPGIFTTNVLGTYLPFEYTAMGEDRDGELYLAARGSGIIFKVTETSSCKPVAVILSPDSQIVSAGSPVLLEAVSGPGITYQWLMNGNPIAGANNSTLSVATAGNYQLQAILNGCTALSDTVTVLQSTSVAANASDLHFSLYPNPNNGTFTVTGIHDQSDEGMLIVQDMLGRELYKKKLSDKKYGNEIKTGLPKGIYRALISSNGQPKQQIFCIE